MMSTVALILVAGLAADGVSVKFIASGATAKTGGYRPNRAEMNEKADNIEKAPEGLEKPKYGTLKIGDQSWQFVLDEPEGKPARLFVDTNGDKDLTNDPPTKWESSKSGNLTMHRGEAQVDLGDGKLATLGLYRFDPTDPQRNQLKNTLMFYTDFGYEIALNLDGKEFTSFVSGTPAPNSSLWIDRDGNKRTSYRREMVKFDTPFNFTGTTYVLKRKGDDFELVKSEKELPVTPMPPDTSLGKTAISFEAVDMDGKKIDFPKSYAGKIVMLDFWATWCGPCIAELPNVTKAYSDWHDKGFEILGISLDNQGMAEKLSEFAKEKDMSWAQIYEGKSWECSLPELYDVSGIPFVLLVDGDTGEILGTSRELRGPGLTEFIGKALEKKNKPK